MLRVTKPHPRQRARPRCRDAPDSPIPSTMAPEKADDIARELARRGHFPRPPGSPSKLRYRQDYDRYLKQAQKTISADPPLEVVDDVIDVVDPDKNHLARS